MKERGERGDWSRGEGVHMGIGKEKRGEEKDKEEPGNEHNTNIDSR